jgi:hypothetical protein
VFRSSTGSKIPVQLDRAIADTTLIPTLIADQPGYRFEVNRRVRQNLRDRSFEDEIGLVAVMSGGIRSPWLVFC